MRKRPFLGRFFFYGILIPLLFYVRFFPMWIWIAILTALVIGITLFYYYIVSTVAEDDNPFLLSIVLFLVLYAVVAFILVKLNPSPGEARVESFRELLMF